MTPHQMKAAAKKSKRAAERNNPQALLDWFEEKGVHMRHIVFAKYDQNRHMKEALLATGNEPFFEAFEGDDYWACGVGIGGTVAQFLASVGGRFRNEMGVITVWVRDELRRRLAADIAMNAANRSVQSFIDANSQ
jgi:predicted NAD-dependent protein-ADP-ribosyltransferase YbiA (DUF1768 family)